MLDMEIVKDLTCPRCSETLVRTQEKAPSPADARNGNLVCQSCESHYPVIDGVPHFAIQLNEQENTAVSYGFQWTAFWKGFFDKGDVFGLSFADTGRYFLRSLGLAEAELSQKKVLDAGTGSGRIPMSIHRMGCHVYAIDIHRKLVMVAERMKDVKNVNFVQADLLNLPFRDGYFDVAWSSGVLMCTPDPKRAFRSISRKVRPGGRLFVSVYGKDFQHYRIFRHLLPFAHYLPPVANYVLAGILAVPLYFAFNSILFCARTFTSQKQPPYKVLWFTFENIEHKTYFSIVLNLFDQLHPRFQTEHSVDEVSEWFHTNDFRDIVVTESVGMVAIRGIRASG